MKKNVEKSLKFFRFLLKCVLREAVTKKYSYFLQFLKNNCEQIFKKKMKLFMNRANIAGVEINASLRITYNIFHNLSYENSA